MTHKKKYVVDGNKVSEYNKEYYKKHRNEILKRAKKRLENNPDMNKIYYAKNKEKHGNYESAYYKKNRENILKQKKEARDRKKVSIVLMDEPEHDLEYHDKKCEGGIV